MTYHHTTANLALAEFETGALWKIILCDPLLTETGMILSKPV